MLNVATALSLVLLIATAAMWVRSYWRMDTLRRSRDAAENDRYSVYQTLVSSDRGMISVTSQQTGLTIVGKPDFASDFLEGHMGVESPSSKWRYSGDPSQKLDFSGWPGIEMSALGFRLFTYQQKDSTDVAAGHRVDEVQQVAAVVPDWAITLPLVVLPGIAVIRFLRHPRFKLAGACPSCGYNLTGNLSGICPECGSQVATKTTGRLTTT